MAVEQSPHPMSMAQRQVLHELKHHFLFPGYCELMLRTGLTSYMAVDWVLNALERRGFIQRDEHGDYEVTEAGRAACVEIIPMRLK